MYGHHIAPFSTPACPDCSQNIQKTDLFCVFSLSNFLSIFPGGSADPICPYVRTPVPHDATTAPYTLSSCTSQSVCLSVCLSQAGIVSKRLDERSWFLAGFFSHLWSILHWVTRKFGFLKSKGKLAFYTSLWNLSDSEPLDREFRQVNCVDNKTRRRSSSFTRWRSARRLG